MLLLDVKVIFNLNYTILICILDVVFIEGEILNKPGDDVL